MRAMGNLYYLCLLCRRLFEYDISDSVSNPLFAYPDFLVVATLDVAVVFAAQTTAACCTAAPTAACFFWASFHWTSEFTSSYFPLLCLYYRINCKLIISFSIVSPLQFDNRYIPMSMSVFMSMTIFGFGTRIFFSRRTLVSSLAVMRRTRNLTVGNK